MRKGMDAKDVKSKAPVDAASGSGSTGTAAATASSTALVVNPTNAKKSGAAGAAGGINHSSTIHATLKCSPTLVDAFPGMVPFGDPYWYYAGSESAYYHDGHKAWRAKVRAFVDTEILPFVAGWDEAKEYPRELHEKAYKAGIYGSMWPKAYGGTPPPDCDAFHDFILIDEISRCSAGGIPLGVFFIMGMALGPVLTVGAQHLRDLVARDVISGKKVHALAITEPYAGSDVAAIQTTARREGDFFIVNGVKKFISAGTHADYFTTAVRTGGPGMAGVSLLLIERTREGVESRKMQMQGWWTSGTALVAFDDVKVPVSNLIGKENDGFRPIMVNFNHERFVIGANANRYARICLEEAIKFAKVRHTFGKPLIAHGVIRLKIAEMARMVESTHALFEQICYAARCSERPGSMPINAFGAKLGGAIALAKVQATRTMDFCAREAAQIFGGASCVRGGPGEKVERLYREVRQNAIAGGSEEILLELALKQSKL